MVYGAAYNTEVIKGQHYWWPVQQSHMGSISLKDLGYPKLVYFWYWLVVTEI